MRVLVAGIGNIFCGDDGFGSAVAQRLAQEPVPDGAEVVDYGIRGVHLAYQLLDGYDLAVLVDAVHRDGPPGAVYVIEHESDAAARDTAPVMDAHDLSPDGVLALVPALGGTLPRVLVVGCEPATADAGIGLSPPVERAVGEAAQVVRDILASAEGRASCASASPDAS